MPLPPDCAQGTAAAETEVVAKNRDSSPRVRSGPTVPRLFVEYGGHTILRLASDGSLGPAVGAAGLRPRCLRPRGRRPAGHLLRREHARAGLDGRRDRSRSTTGMPRGPRSSVPTTSSRMPPAVCSCRPPARGRPHPSSVRSSIAAEDGTPADGGRRPALRQRARPLARRTTLYCSETYAYRIVAFTSATMAASPSGASSRASADIAGGGPPLAPDGLED